MMRFAAALMPRLVAVVSALLLPVNRRQTASGLRLLGSKSCRVTLRSTARWPALGDRDRRSHTGAPARFYSATIGIAGDRLGAFRITGQTTFKREDGIPYPTRGSDEQVPSPRFTIRLFAIDMRGATNVPRLAARC